MDPATTLAATAAVLGLVHTLIGPDHYVPFIAMGRARGWSLGKTLRVTLLCGLGHVAGSVLLGGLGIALGWPLLGMERLEGLRGELAGWLLLGFGLAYLAWGVRRAWRRRPHDHWHAHEDGTVHCHSHAHVGAHAHLHAADGRRGLTPWALFVLFVLGPCEPLIPLLMYPAALERWNSVVTVAIVFGVSTLAVMLAVVATGYLGLSHLGFGRFARYAHAIGGLALVACGVAMRLGL